MEKGLKVTLAVIGVVVVFGLGLLTGSETLALWLDPGTGGR